MYLYPRTRAFSVIYVLFMSPTLVGLTLFIVFILTQTGAHQQRVDAEAQRLSPAYEAALNQAMVTKDHSQQAGMRAKLAALATKDSDEAAQGLFALMLTERTVTEPAGCNPAYYHLSSFHGNWSWHIDPYARNIYDRHSKWYKASPARIAKAEALDQPCLSWLTSETNASAIEAKLSEEAGIPSE